MVAKICMVLIFVGVAVGVGLYCRRTTTSVDGFVLGGRNVGPWMSAFAYGTSYFSAVVFVGYAGQFGWKYGIAAVWAGIGNAILGSLLAWWVLGPRTREMTHRLGATTMPEFFGKRFKSKGLRIASAAIIFVFLIPYTASVYNGLSRLFGMAFGLPYEVCVIGMAIITCLYVVLGGYMATVMNDFLQGIVMLFGIVAVIAAVILTALPELLRGSFSDYRMLIYAILLIVMMLVNNNETMKMYTERFKGYLHLDGRAKASKTSKASAKEQEVS